MELGCVILAAGSAVRFGGNKLTARFRGKMLIEWAFDAVPAERLSAVAVVTQYPVVEALAAARGFETIRNPEPELGISRSVVLGTAALAERCGGIVYLAADQPLLRRATVEGLLERFLEDPTRVAVPAAGERQGNPCVFPKTLFPELLTITGDRGGRQIKNRHPELVTLVPVPEEELFDVDTLSDLNCL